MEQLEGQDRSSHHLARDPYSKKLKLREFLTDNHGVAQLAHLLALGSFLVGVGIVGISLYFLFWQRHPEGFVAMSVGAGLIAGGKILEGYERKVEGHGNLPGK
jgi:hypothetical protein